MIGHGAYIQEYQRRTDQQKKELWDEVESEVLIFDTAIKEQKIKQLTQTADLVTTLQSQPNMLTEKLKMSNERLRRSDERLSILESELPNYKITRIRKSTNPKVLDSNTKFYV